MAASHLPRPERTALGSARRVQVALMTRLYRAGQDVNVTWSPGPYDISSTVWSHIGLLALPVVKLVTVTLIPTHNTT